MSERDALLFVAAYVLGATLVLTVAGVLVLGALMMTRRGGGLK